MADLKKHVGRIKNTEQRCVLVFMQLPGDEGHALVINTESLPARYEQTLMEVVESPEGQTAQELGPVMSRRFMPDSNIDVLNTFHNAGLLRREPVDNIIMLPRPHFPFPLRHVLEAMGRTVKSPTDPVVADPKQKFNPYESNQGALKAEQKLGIAKSLLIDAQMLEEQAARKRHDAYAMAPELEPGKPPQAQPRPAVNPTQKAMLDDAELIQRIQAMAEPVVQPPVEQAPSETGVKLDSIAEDASDEELEMLARLITSETRKLHQVDVGDMDPMEAKRIIDQVRASFDQSDLAMQHPDPGPARLVEEMRQRGHLTEPNPSEPPKRRGPGRPRKNEVR